MAHAAPMAVCLYRTLMSRQTRKYSKSRYLHRSNSCSADHPRTGAMVCTDSLRAPMEPRSADVMQSSRAMIAEPDPRSRGRSFARDSPAHGSNHRAEAACTWFNRSRPAAPRGLHLCAVPPTPGHRSNEGCGRAAMPTLPRGHRTDEHLESLIANERIRAPVACEWPLRPALVRAPRHRVLSEPTSSTSSSVRIRSARRQVRS